MVNCAHFKAWYGQERDLISSNLFFLTSTGLSVLPTIFLNGLTLFTIWRKPSLHSPSNIFICNLAMSDLAVGAVAIPLTMAWKITEMSHENLSVVCAVGYCATVMGNAAAGTSFVTLIAATVDRYLALRYHLHYPTIVTTSRVTACCIACWVLAIAVGFSSFGGNIVYEIVNPVLNIPFIAVMVVCYYKIYLIAQRHHNQIQSQVTNKEQVTPPNISRFKKTVSVLVYLSIVFFAVYSPYIAISVYQKFEGYTLFYFNAWNISASFIFISSTLNPIIYCWRFKEFRTAMKESFYLLFRSN